MSSSQNIQERDHSTDVAPTPQNTPLDTAVLANRPANLGKPKVEDVVEGEDEDDEEGDEDVGDMNPASLLASVSEACFTGTNVTSGEMYAWGGRGFYLMRNWRDTQRV
jgi:hypothetical protein